MLRICGRRGSLLTVGGHHLATPSVCNILSLSATSKSYYISSDFPLAKVSTYSQSVFRSDAAPDTPIFAYIHIFVRVYTV